MTSYNNPAFIADLDAELEPINSARYSNVSSGAGVPGSTPTKVGDIYIDTDNDEAYVAVGTASSSDWEKGGGGGGGSGDLVATNNLSDLDNAATARTNLGLGTAATTAATAYATAAQGALADTATQPGDLGTLAVQDDIAVPGDLAATGVASSSTFLRGDGTWASPAGGGGGDLLAANNLSDVDDAATARTNLGLGTAATTAATAYATAAQGALADTATQPGDLGTLAVKDDIVVPGDITATGTPSAGTFLRGDGSWSAVPASISGVVEDTNPQLGGDLDAADFKIYDAAQVSGISQSLSFTAGEADADFSTASYLTATITATNNTIHLVGASSGKTSYGFLTLKQDVTGGHVVTIDGWTSTEGDISVSQAASSSTRLAVAYEGTSVTLIGQVDVTSFYGIDGPVQVSISDGGTGGSTAGQARTNLGLDINTDVQAYDARLGIVHESFTIFTAGTTVVTGDGIIGHAVPPSWNGRNLTSITAVTTGPGTTGTMDIQVRRQRAGAAVDMLSTKATIDSTEYSSSTAATAAVINLANDDLLTGDVLFIDVDAVHTTPATGLFVVIEAS